MKRSKLFTGMVMMLVIIATVGLSGCMEYERKLEITGSGVSLIVNDALVPLDVTIVGSENVVTFDRNVTVNHITITFGVVNNTIYLYGQSCINGTSTYQPHNCAISDNGGNTRISYYGG